MKPKVVYFGKSDEYRIVIGQDRRVLEERMQDALGEPAWFLVTRGPHGLILIDAMDKLAEMKIKGDAMEEELAGLRADNAELRMKIAEQCTGNTAPLVPGIDVISEAFDTHAQLWAGQKEVQG